jgi:hypothetical protein
MKTVTLRRVQVEMIAATRFMFGAGCALLMSRCITPEKRQVLGWTLTAIGAITSIPLILLVYGQEAKHANA